jgi:hypothetical protein
LLAPLFKKATGRDIQAKMHLRQIVGLEEALLAGWLRLRAEARPVLLALDGRVDASAVLYHFENTLAQPTLLYDCVLKQKKHEVYWWGLNFALLEVILRQRHNYPGGLFRKIDEKLYLHAVRHPLHEVLCTNVHVVDEAFGEGGVNALIHRWVRNIWSDAVARDTALRNFATRLEPGVRAMQEGFLNAAEPRCVVTGRPMEEMVQLAMLVIVELLEKIVNAREAELPRRVPKGNARRKFSTDAWLCPTLCEGKLYSHEFASPAWALFAEERRQRAPDGIRSETRCNWPRCRGRQAAQLLVLECGHAFCKDCSDCTRCLICLEEIRRRLLEEGNAQELYVRTRVVNVDELHETDQKNAGSDDDGEDGEDDDDGDVPDANKFQKFSFPNVMDRLAALKPEPTGTKEKEPTPTVPLCLSPKKRQEAMAALAESSDKILGRGQRAKKVKPF